MRVRNFFGKVSVQLLTGNQEAKYTRYGSASVRNLAKYGRSFQKTFPNQIKKGRKQYAITASRGIHESELMASVTTHGDANPTRLGSLHLGFRGKTIYVEAVQGAEGRKTMLNELRRTLKGVPWQNYLLGEVEKHARALGFKKIKIRAPETLYYYHYPAYKTNIDDLILCEKAKLKTEGKSESEINQEIDTYQTKLESNKFFRRREEKKAIQRHQQIMRTAYEKLAEGMGYTKSGLVYVKTL